MRDDDDFHDDRRGFDDEAFFGTLIWLAQRQLDRRLCSLEPVGWAAPAATCAVIVRGCRRRKRNAFLMAPAIVLHFSSLILHNTREHLTRENLQCLTNRNPSTPWPSP